MTLSIINYLVACVPHDNGPFTCLFIQVVVCVLRFFISRMFIEFALFVSSTFTEFMSCGVLYYDFDGSRMFSVIYF